MTRKASTLESGFARSKGKWSSRNREIVPRRICIICGGRFYAPPIQMRRGGGKFCSKKCYGKAKETNGAGLLQKPCAYCGKIFKIHPCHFERSICCSRECSNLYRTKEPNKCDVCGKLSGNNKYCSAACQRSRPPHNWKGGPTVAAVCLTCGKGFDARRPDVARGMGIYCSRRCFAKDKLNNELKPYKNIKGGKRPDLENRYFRSSWEANWARYLNWLIDKGEILKWEYEPETFEFVNIKRGSKFYTPDFRVTNKDGSQEYHEVKGWMDAKSLTKLKRMKKFYPGVKIVVVEKKMYYAVARTLRLVIAGWELNNKHST